MSETDWDTVTKIGTKVRGPGANTQKEKVIRSESQLNAARRQGVDIATEKKYGGSNQVGHRFSRLLRLPKSFSRSNGSEIPNVRRVKRKWGVWNDADVNEWTNWVTLQVKGGEGQHLTKVDRSDDIVKPKTVGQDVANAIKAARGSMKNDKGAPMTQKDLATKINQTPTVVADYERGTAAPNEKILSDMERVLKVYLRGKSIGEPKTFGKKKKDGQ